jgi:hypothetical protein
MALLFKMSWGHDLNDKDLTFDPRIMDESFSLNVGTGYSQWCENCDPENLDMPYEFINRSDLKGRVNHVLSYRDPSLDSDEYANTIFTELKKLIETPL